MQVGLASRVVFASHFFDLSQFIHAGHAMAHALIWHRMLKTSSRWRADAQRKAKSRSDDETSKGLQSLDEDGMRHDGMPTPHLRLRHVAQQLPEALIPCVEQKDPLEFWYVVNAV